MLNILKKWLRLAYIEWILVLEEGHILQYIGTFFLDNVSSDENRKLCVYENDR